MTDMISFGGGVNSIAMTILLVEEDWQGPIVFADTGGEWPETYCYMDYFEEEFLAPRSRTIIRLSPGSEYHRSKADVSLERYCLEQGLVPLVFARWCTDRWKVTPLLNWRREQSMEKMLLAIAAEEAHRAKPRPFREYPLVERCVDREGCKEIIQDQGLELPRRSNCFYCPFQRMSSWRDLWTLHPDLFERAASMERNASEKVGKKFTLIPSKKKRARSAPTLDELKVGFETQTELPGFEYEYLREFQGCVCGL